MKATRIFALGVTLMSAASASGAEKGGVSMSDTVTVGDQKLSLNGMGIREATVFKVDVYVAGLYVQTKSQDADAIINAEEAKRIVMHFVRGIEKEEIAGAYVEAFKKMGAGAELSKKLARLNSWMTEMKKGQEIVLTYIPETGVELLVNGQTKGTIAGADFAQAMWRIWLGKHPPNQGLKDGMLGR